MIQYETIGGQQVKRDNSALREALNKARAQGASYSITDWESYLNAIDPNCMALGLDRIREVAQRLHLFEDLVNNSTYIVAVAGTNGKGSTSALIAHAMNNLGFKVGLFTSPHLVKFNERININGKDIDDALLAQCINEVTQAQFPDSKIEAIIDPDASKFEPHFAEEDFEELEVDHEAEEAELAASQANSSSSASANGDSSSSQPLGFGKYVKSEDVIDLRSDLIAKTKSKPRPYKNEIVDLSYFEITTLAAMRAFMHSGCEIVVLEVGLGGRLDAVNLFYNDIAIITSIGLDHVKILGNTTGEIAHEKAGIIKPYGEVILGANMDDLAELEIMRVAKTNDAKCFIENQSFKVEVVPKDTLDEQTQKELETFGSLPLNKTHEICYTDKALNFALYFPYPKVPVSCVGMALNAIFKLNDALGVENDFTTMKDIEEAIVNVALPGRMQKVAEHTDIYLDVAHNVPAAQHLRDHLLSEHLEKQQCTDANAALGVTTKTTQHNQKTRAVIGMLKDKDVEGVLEVLKSCFSDFYVASLPGDRGESKDRLKDALDSQINHDKQTVKAYDTVEQALTAAKQEASEVDTIVVMGSFVTVAEAKTALGV